MDMPDEAAGSTPQRHTAKLVPLLGGGTDEGKFDDV